MLGTIHYRGQTRLYVYPVILDELLEVSKSIGAKGGQDSVSTCEERCGRREKRATEKWAEPSVWKVSLAVTLVRPFP
jgi:hypothetical protein